jgi:hypothetical protein
VDLLTFQKKTLHCVPLKTSLKDTVTDIYILCQCVRDEGAAEVVLISSEVTEVLSMKVNPILQYLLRHTNYSQELL